MAAVDLLFRGFNLSGLPRPLVFGDEGLSTNGFQAARFGIPFLPLPQQAPVAGFAPVRFGTPAFVHVQGIKAPHFGPIFIAFPQFPPVQGFLAPAFGTPIAGSGYAVFGFAPVHFGQLALLPHVAGFKASHFGTPGLQIRVGSLVPVVFGVPQAFSRLRALSWRPVHFGLIGVATHQVVQPVGGRVGHFGHPVNVRWLRASRHISVRQISMRPARWGHPTV